jgi:hypothetical protein
MDFLAIHLHGAFAMPDELREAAKALVKQAGSLEQARELLEQADLSGHPAMITSEGKVLDSTRGFTWLYTDVVDFNFTTKGGWQKEDEKDVSPGVAWQVASVSHRLEGAVHER